MRANELFDQLLNSLALSVDESEKRAMVRWLLEDRLGFSWAEIQAGKITKHAPTEFAQEIQRLNAGEPLQYVLGYAWFYGRPFDVTKEVLIPRPETELLVEFTIASLGRSFSGSLLDIGTGSGCIAITLALELPKATVMATDISNGAIKTAQGNANKFHTLVTLLDHNILIDPISDQLDAIVSNPPYVRESERATMNLNVKEFEPPGALFVPNIDPLVFHRTIAQKAMFALKPGGLLAMEINETLGIETFAVISELGYTEVVLHKDLDNKNRFISARRPNLTT